MELHMTRRTQSLGGLLVIVGCLVAAPVGADVYTWIDAKGTTNVSNVPPPAGVRVIGTTHENPAAIARAEALHKADQDAQVRALSERVAELERAVGQAERTPPPATFHAAPPDYAPPPAQFTVTTLPYEQPNDIAPPYGLGCAWAGCPLGFYPAPFVVVSRGFDGRRSFGQRKHGNAFAGPRHRSMTPPRVAALAHTRPLLTARAR
jgi:hypothetical protein